VKCDQEPNQDRHKAVQSVPHVRYDRVVLQLASQANYYFGGLRLNVHLKPMMQMSGQRGHGK
jgi:hypothetical protein